MPTRTLRRIWCKTCNEFELHEGDFKTKELLCKECGTAYSDVYLKDIPKEKVLEQRKRYKDYQRKRDTDLFSYILKPRNPWADMFSEPGSDVEIIESDAGQKKLDDKEREKARQRMEEYRKKREEEKELLKKYRGLGRNDTCLCGSGLKYKKCCWEKIQNIRP